MSTIVDLWVHITLHYDNSIKVPSSRLLFAVSRLNYQQVQAEMDFYSREIKLHTLPSLPLLVQIPGTNSRCIRTEIKVGFELFC